MVMVVQLNQKQDGQEAVGVVLKLQEGFKQLSVHCHDVSSENSSRNINQASFTIDDMKKYRHDRGCLSRVHKLIYTFMFRKLVGPQLKICPCSMTPELLTPLVFATVNLVDTTLLEV